MTTAGDSGLEEPLSAIEAEEISTTASETKTNNVLSPFAMEVVPVVVLDQNNPLPEDAHDDDNHDDGDEDDSSQAVGVDSPVSTRELLEFAVPTLGIWILQPVLSLIDSSVVGVSARTLQRNYAEIIDRFKNKGKASLRKKNV